jgi:predicted aspartyl protease
MSQHRADRIKGEREYKGVITVPCQVNDLYQGYFLVDTGAAFTTISQRFAEETQ